MFTRLESVNGDTMVREALVWRTARQFIAEPLK